MFKKLGFETATYPPFCTMSWNILGFFDGVPKTLLGWEPLSIVNYTRTGSGIHPPTQNSFLKSSPNVPSISSPCL